MSVPSPNDKHSSRQRKPRDRPRSDGGSAESGGSLRRLSFKPPKEIERTIKKLWSKAQHAYEGGETKRATRIMQRRVDLASKAAVELAKTERELGEYFKHRGKIRQAISHLEAGLKHAGSLDFGFDPEERIRCLTQLGDVGLLMLPEGNQSKMEIRRRLHQATAEVVELPPTASELKAEVLLARAKYERHAEDCPEAVEGSLLKTALAHALEAFGAESPKLVRFIKELAEYCLRSPSEGYEEAQHLFKRLLKILPSKEPLNEHFYDSYYGLSRALAGQGQFTAALKAIHSSFGPKGLTNSVDPVSEFSNRTHLLVALAFLTYVRGHHESARAWLTVAFTCTKSRRSVAEAITRLFEDFNCHEPICEFLQTSARKIKNYHFRDTIYLSLADTLSELEQTGKAREVLKEGLATIPSGAQKRTARAFQFISRLATTLDDHDELPREEYENIQLTAKRFEQLIAKNPAKHLPRAQEIAYTLRCNEQTLAAKSLWAQIFKACSSASKIDPNIRISTLCEYASWKYEDNSPEDASAAIALALEIAAREEVRPATKLALYEAQLSSMEEEEADSEDIIKVHEALLELARKHSGLEVLHGHLSNYAQFLYSSDRPDAAEIIFSEEQKVHELRGVPDRLAMANCLAMRSECARLTDRESAAKSFAEQASEILSTELAEGHAPEEVHDAHIAMNVIKTIYLCGEQEKAQIITERLIDLSKKSSAPEVTAAILSSVAELMHEPFPPIKLVEPKTLFDLIFGLRPDIGPGINAEYAQELIQSAVDLAEHLQAHELARLFREDLLDS